MVGFFYYTWFPFARLVRGESVGGGASFKGKGDSPWLDVLNLGVYIVHKTSVLIKIPSFTSGYSQVDNKINISFQEPPIVGN